MRGKIVIIRHGETDLNGGHIDSPEERIRGWMEVPLNDAGRRSAREVARNLKKEIPRVDKLYASPLSRAADTAKEIAKAFGVKKTKEEYSLMPWNVGQFSGQLAKDVGPQMDKLVLKEHISAPGGEPFAAFRRRALKFVHSLIQEIKRTTPIVDVEMTNERELIYGLVTHTRVANLILAWEAAGCPENLHIDPERMVDYSHEVQPGHYMTLVVR